VKYICESVGFELKKLRM